MSDAAHTAPLSNYQPQLNEMLHVLYTTFALVSDSIMNLFDICNSLCQWTYSNQLLSIMIIIVIINAYYLYSNYYKRRLAHFWRTNAVDGLKVHFGPKIMICDHTINHVVTSFGILYRLLTVVY